MADRIGIARQIAFILAGRDLSDAPTLGDLADELQLRTGTAIGERLREARKHYGFDIRCITDGEGDEKSYKYLMPPEERARVKQLPDYQKWRVARLRVSA